MKIFLVCFCSLLLSLRGFSQQPPGGHEGGGPVTGRLSGKLVDSTGHGISGASVMILPRPAGKGKNALPKRPMAIIITAYKKFAPDGFDLDVVDYMVKPVGMERFMKACYKALELHQLRTGAGTSTPAADYFFVNIDYSLVKVLFKDISWMEGSGDYVKMHLISSPKPLLVRMSAKALEAELPSDRFFRIHKSYIVSIASVTAVRKNSVFIGELELPVGESYRETLRSLTKRNF